MGKQLRSLFILLAVAFITATSCSEQAVDGNSDIALPAFLYFYTDG